MKQFTIALILCLLSYTSFASDDSFADTQKHIAQEKVVVNQLLNDFLANSVNDDLKNHQRFWADDLIYTSSSGTRFDKSHIIDGIKANQHAGNKADTLPPVYWAENTDIRIYGDTAIVAFTLMHKENVKANTVKQTYFNTGTLLKRNGIWQVVAWQATKIPTKKVSAK